MSKPFLLLLAAAACSTAEAGKVATYDCDGIRVGAQTPDIDPAVLGPWKRLAAVHDVTPGYAADAQLLAMTKLPPLSMRGRIHLQHQMLNVARRLDHARRSNASYRLSHQMVMTRILAIAPSKEDFAMLGSSAHPHVQPILGPASGIVERATRTCGEGNGIHASYFGGLLAFRPIRVDSTRALVAQIVAFDDEGTPHITPIVEGMEIRRGFNGDAPACVIQTRADGTLYPAKLAQVEEHEPFVTKTGDGVGCNRCHGNGNGVGARDLTGDQVGDVDRKRDRQVGELATRLWNSLEWNVRWQTDAVDSAP